MTMTNSQLRQRRRLQAAGPICARRKSGRPQPSRLETNSQPQKVGTEFAENRPTSVPTAVRVAAGWRPSRTQQQAAPASSGPVLSVVAN